jgi:hypothetical protein
MSSMHCAQLLLTIPSLTKVQMISSDWVQWLLSLAATQYLFACSSEESCVPAAPFRIYLHSSCLAACRTASDAAAHSKPLCNQLSQ